MEVLMRDPWITSSTELTRPFYKPQEVADRYFVSKQVIYKWVKNGTLRAIRMGDSPQAHLRFSRDELVDFERRNRLIPLPKGIDEEEVRRDRERGREAGKEKARQRRQRQQEFFAAYGGNE
jgi:excisionase family DNA binding protein